MPLNGSKRHLVLPSETWQHDSVGHHVSWLHWLCLRNGQTHLRSVQALATTLPGRCEEIVGCSYLYWMPKPNSRHDGGVEGKKAGSNSYRPYFQLARGERPTMCIDFRSSRKEIRSCFPDLLFVALVTIFSFVSICLSSLFFLYIASNGNLISE